MDRSVHLENIKQRRKSLKLSQSEMAQALGFKNASTYSKYETGEYVLKADMLPILSKTLDVPISYFFALNSSETEQPS